MSVARRSVALSASAGRVLFGGAVSMARGDPRSVPKPLLINVVAPC